MIEGHLGLINFIPFILKAVFIRVKKVFYLLSSFWNKPRQFLHAFLDLVPSQFFHALLFLPSFSLLQRLCIHAKQIVFNIFLPRTTVNDFNFILLKQRVHIRLSVPQTRRFPWLFISSANALPSNIPKRTASGSPSKRQDAKCDGQFAILSDNYP